MKRTKIFLAVLAVAMLSMTGCADKAVDYTASSDEIVVPEKTAIPDAATAVEKIINDEDLLEMPENDTAQEDDVNETDVSDISDSDDAAEDANQKEDFSDNTEEIEKTDVSEPTKADTDSADSQETGAEAEITVYYVQGDFDKFKTEVVSIEALTPDNVVSELEKKNILPVDTKVNSCETTVSDMGTKTLHLDVSNSYETYISTMGMQAELAIINSVANTFIKAYGTDEFRLTVGGESVKSINLGYDCNFSFSDDPQVIIMSGEMQAVPFN